MPTLFDSHAEFNEWFSKGIESHAQNKSSDLDTSALLDLSVFCCLVSLVNANLFAVYVAQLSRLHLILKPFMLRRIKKDVQHELADKVGLNDKQH